nr:RNA-dependent RNA polymerase [Monilinia fructicola botourmiavirus 12]
MANLAIVHPSRRARTGRCRAFQKRTLEYISKAYASWQAIFVDESHRVLDLRSTRSCLEFAGVIKKFLSEEVSSDQCVQMGFQSIKKGLPSSCACMDEGLLDNLVSTITSSPSPPPSSYLRFVKQETDRLFYKGWDASYEGFCLTTSPPLSSTVSQIRAHGGCLSDFSGRSQADYLESVLNGRGDLPKKLRGEVFVVQSAGKPRALTRFESESLYLRPLHKSIYSRLRREKWLLTGDPTEEKMKRAGFREGKGELVSGDYKSATDGLSIEVAEVALASMLANSIFVPENVKSFALSALRPHLVRSKLFDGVNDEGSHQRYELDMAFDVSVGQMMGSYLSFPLLCLQNYLAFKWSLRGTKEVGKVPVLINGDDILFQKDDHFSKWSACLKPVGLTVETTKTSVSSSFGTINSTLLEWSNGLLSPSWSPRLGMFREPDHPSSLGTDFLRFLKGCNDPSVRYRAGYEWFRWQSPRLRRAGCSLPELGFRGLLARRLAKKFGLLDLRSFVFPLPFKRHEVGINAERVDSVDFDALGSEERHWNSVEIVAEKWNKGFLESEVTRSAIRHCLLRSSLTKVDRPLVSLEYFYCSDSKFDFLRRNLLKERKPKNASVKDFLRPFDRENKVLVHTSILDFLRQPYEDLPSYSLIDEAPVTVLGA